MAGGHGAFATAEDYGRFITMLLRGGTAPDGTRVLSEETRREAFTDQLGGLTVPRRDRERRARAHQPES